MSGRLARVWTGWKIIAHLIGNFQARLLLAFFYFLVVPPFALIVKIFKDPLALRPRSNDSLWVDGPVPDPSLEAAKKQF